MARLSGVGMAGEGIGRRILRGVALAGLMLSAGPAFAEEPLFIRIRPNPQAGSGEAARAALWARREAHARTVIESICTGCLGAWKPLDSVAPPATPGPVQARIADLTVSPGLETDTGSGASGPAPDSSTSERQP